MTYSIRLALLFTLTCFASSVVAADNYQDRARGAWAGQILGAAAGSAPDARLQLSAPKLEVASTQSFLRVQLLFLQALEQHGEAVSRPQVATLLGASDFPLSHAGLTARQNLRRGMRPDFTGHPRFNPHSDDHDFQSSAAVFGLVRPGSAREAAKLADLFGGLMSYGDGQYGGRFLATVYAQAFLEKDATPEAVERCVHAGLAAVHPDSAYAAVGREVLEQFRREPNDWQKARAAIWDRWGEGDSCPQGAHEVENFDAKLNGGFIMIGLLYGRGDLARTLEIVAGCGQQLRENSAAAAGVLGTLLGFKKLSRTAGIDESEFASLKLAGRDLTEIVRACERMAGKNIGAENQILRMDAQSPEAPRELEQMHAAFNRRQLQMWNGAATVAFFDKMPQWDADWELVSTGYDGAPSVRKFQGRPAVLVTHPVDKVEPAILRRTVRLPLKHPRLLLTVASFPDAATDDKKSLADWLLRVRVDGKPILEKVINTEERWEELSVDLSRYAGKTIVLTLENAPGGALEFAYETAYWASAKVVGE